MTDPRPRVRIRRARRKPRLDPYIVSLASAGGLCSVVALLVLLSRPSWNTPVIGQPLGAFLLGGLGGLTTLSTSPERARRIRLRSSARLMAVTAYRLVVACIMGGIGHAIVASMAGASGLVFPEWLPAVGAAAFGVLELVLNDVLLRMLGWIRANEIDAGAS